MPSLCYGRTKTKDTSIIILFSVVFIVIISVNQSSCYLLGVPPNQIGSDPFEAVNYSIAEVNNGYNSSTKYYARGMGHLFYITRLFMNFVLQGEAYPEGLITVSHNNLRIADYRDEWRALVQHYGLMILVVVLGLLFVVVMPFIGLFFCCCRCAGRCGSRSQPFEKRYDPCRRHTHGFLLSNVTILIMFGVVCAFVTNEYLETGIQTFPTDLRTNLRDTDLYINNTKKEVNNLLITNFNELEATLNSSLHRSGEIIKDVLVWLSRAEVISNLTNIVSGLRIIRSDLSAIDKLTIVLKDKAVLLEQALQETRNTLMERLKLCMGQQVCVDFLRNYNITHLSLEKDFTQLPNVTASLHNLSTLLESDIEKEVSKGQEEFEKVRSYIQKTVDENTPIIVNSIKTAGQALKDSAIKITVGMENVRKPIAQESPRSLDQAEQFLKEFGHYRYYLGLGVSCTLLVMLTCLVFGLFCGYCGKRPDGGYSDDCCDKGTGARFLMLGVWLMFISSGCLMILTVIYFVSGVLAERAVCQPLHNPSNTRIFNLIDDLVANELHYSYPDSPPLRASTVINKCHRNQSIYSVLDLQNVVDVQRFLKFPEQYGITSRIQEMTKRIKLDSHVEILTPSAKEQLRRLAVSPLNNFNISMYTNVLTEKITSIDLLQLAAALNDTAMKLPPDQKKIKISLLLQCDYLKFHQKQNLEMLRITQQLENTANNLTEHLRFNEPSLQKAIEKMLLQVEKAQTMLNKDGPNIVTNISHEFGDQFTQHVSNYMERVVKNLENDVGKCWPMSRVYNSTVVTVCNKILDPYNGFWVSVGFILILFLPAIVLSVKLASLYQKSDPYPGPLVEAEYLYDAYADRDNIPLANVHEKKKKKQHRGGYHETYENAGGGSAGGDYSAHLGRGERAAGGQDQRYNDMAPKHWDFPNGGPPRYHSPPLSTEYERPPPYYYPGPAPVNHSS